jgi:hypothetical protein
MIVINDRVVHVDHISEDLSPWLCQFTSKATSSDQVGQSDQTGQTNQTSQVPIRWPDDKSAQICVNFIEHFYNKKLPDINATMVSDQPYTKCIDTFVLSQIDLLSIAELVSLRRASMFLQIPSLTAQIDMRMAYHVKADWQSIECLPCKDPALIVLRKPGQAGQAGQSSQSSQASQASQSNQAKPAK